MFKVAIYCNTFFFFIMSIIFLIKVFSKKSDLKKLRKLVIVYFLLNIINLCASEMTDIGWDIVKLFPFFAISFVIHIVIFCFIKKKIKQRDDNDYKSISIKKLIILTVIPIIILLVPFIYELYILNNCEYMLRYNYQEAFINSEDTYIAIINNKPVKVTLQTDIWDREGISTNNLDYGIVYANDIEITKPDYEYNKITVEDEDIKKIALDALERCQSAKGASVNYFTEGKYAIISLMDEETYGTILGEYFYYDGVYVKSINTHGELEEVTYYK